MRVADHAPGESPYSETELLLADELVRTHHAQLVQIARDRRRNARFADTMMTYDLLHEAYLRIERSEGFHSIRHFLGVASLAMRHVVIDHARRKVAAKKAGSEVLIDADDIAASFNAEAEDLAAIGSLMDGLSAVNPRWLRVFDARYFGGLTEAETATLLGVSERTVRRDWNEARGWLSQRIRSAD